MEMGGDMRYIIAFILSILLVWRPTSVYGDDNNVEYVDRKFIIRNEGLINHPYLDVGGLKTYCVGRLASRSYDLKEFYSDKECLALLEVDLQLFANAIAPCITVSLNPNQYTAVMDFAYNLGPQAYCISTLHRDINDHNYQSLKADFSAWDKVDVDHRLVVIKSIHDRRLREYFLFVRRP